MAIPVSTRFEADLHGFSSLTHQSPTYREPKGPIMNRPFTRMYLLSIVLVCVQAADAASPATAAAPTGSQSAQTVYPTLEEAAIAAWQFSDPDLPAEYYVHGPTEGMFDRPATLKLMKSNAYEIYKTHADLNGDGVDEVLMANGHFVNKTGRESSFDGAQNRTWAVLQNTRGGWLIVGTGFGSLCPPEVLKESTHGWKNIRSGHHLSAGIGSTYLYEFNGTRYKLVKETEYGHLPTRPTTGPATQTSSSPASVRWSNATNGLRARIEAGPYLAKRLGNRVDVYFENVSDEPFSLDFGELQALSWAVFDATGKDVKPIAVQKAEAVPDWHSIAPGQQLGMVLGKSVQNRDGRLQIGVHEWKLQPGRYSIHCMLELRSDAASRPAGQTPWSGRVELPPAEFEVVGEVSDENLIEAGEQVRAAHPAGGLAMWQALAELVRPGMTVRQMFLVLPAKKMTLEEMGGAGILWMGGIFSLNYRVDALWCVEAVGVGETSAGLTNPSTQSQAIGFENMILTRKPAIKPAKASIVPATQPG